MFFDFSFKSATLLIFFIHGIIFSIILLRKGIQAENRSNIWLAAFIFLCSLYIAPFMFGYAGWYSKKLYREILFFTPFQQLFLLPPVIYFYIKNTLYKSFKSTKKDSVHFIPAIIYLLYSFIILIADKGILDEYYFYANGRDKDFDLWYQIAGFISMIYYLVLSLKMYHHYKKTTYQTVSYADSILFKWIQRFLIAFLLLLVIRLLFFIINPEWGEFGRKYWYYLSFSILFYYISISGLINTAKAIIPFHTSDVFKPEPSDDHEAKKIIEEESTQESEQYEILKSKLKELMITDKVFKNPTLTLFDLAQDLSTTPKMISKVINKGFKMNFNDFINTYRSKEVIQKLELGEANLQTLLGIALDSGFNSKSTFNRAFKKHTLLTPKEFIKTHHK